MNYTQLIYLIHWPRTALGDPIMSTWVEDIVTALTNLGGEAKLKDIYDEVEKVRPSPDLSVRISRQLLEV
jgi:hypothetical protein